MAVRSMDRRREALALLLDEVQDTAAVLRRRGDRIAAAAELTRARWQLLRLVATGGWTVVAAADHLRTSRQAVQRLANELELDGTLTFEANPRHRRSPLLAVTASGAALLRTADREARTEDAALLADLAELGDAEIAAVRHALRLVAAGARRQLR